MPHSKLPPAPRRRAGGHNKTIEYRPRILVVEDEPALGRLLKQALDESGFVAAVAGDGEEGLRLADGGRGADLLVVDAMMPVLDGFEMVRRLRASGARVPVLFLTARDAPADRIAGLDLGGDDYMVKPFDLGELLARLRALLRRARDAGDVRAFGDLWADARSRKVGYGPVGAGVPIHLSATEFGLLWTLLAVPGETVSKEAILREVWDEAPSDAPGDAPRRHPNIVEVYVNYLRAKLETRGRPRLVHTVRGKGYVLDARPAPAADPNGDVSGT